MKKLFFLFFLSAGFFFSSQITAQDHFPTKIGEIVNGVLTITYDQDLLKQEWQSFLSLNSGIDVTFSTVAIHQERSMYVLRGSNADNSTNSALILVLDGSGFYEEQGFSGKGTCTCSGCPVGCNPKWDEALQQWWCTDCTYPWGSKDCKKTVTVSSLATFGGSNN